MVCVKFFWVMFFLSFVNRRGCGDVCLSEVCGFIGVKLVFIVIWFVSGSLGFNFCWFD